MLKKEADKIREAGGGDLLLGRGEKGQLLQRELFPNGLYKPAGEDLFSRCSRESLDEQIDGLFLDLYQLRAEKIDPFGLFPGEAGGKISLGEGTERLCRDTAQGMAVGMTPGEPSVGIP